MNGEGGCLESPSAGKAPSAMRQGGAPVHFDTSGAVGAVGAVVVIVEPAAVRQGGAQLSC